MITYSAKEQKLLREQVGALFARRNARWQEIREKIERGELQLVGTLEYLREKQRDKDAPVVTLRSFF